MKATVISLFRDKDNPNVLYKAGETIDFDKERIDNLVSRGLVRAVAEQKTTKSKRSR